MKKVVIGLIGAIFWLHAADDRLAQLTTKQKQKIIFDQFRPEVMQPDISTACLSLDAAQREAEVEIIRKFFYPGKQGYEIGKNYIKKIFYFVQQSSSATEHKSILRVSARMRALCSIDIWKVMCSKEGFKQLTQQTIQAFDIQSSMPIIISAIQQMRYAYQLQKKLDVPRAKEYHIDAWYHKRILRDLAIVERAILAGEPIVLLPSLVLAELPLEPIEDQEMNELVKDYIKTSKEVFQQELRKLDENPLRDLSQSMGKFVGSFSK